MIELEYQLKTYLLNFPMKMSKNSYQLIYNLLEKLTILEKDTIISTTQLERESTNTFPDISTNLKDTYALDTTHNRQTPQLKQITIQMTRTSMRTWTKHQDRKHHQIPETTPIPTIHDTPIITATQLVPETTDTTPPPTENTQTDNDTQKDTDTETETETETETQPKTDKITVRKPKQTHLTLSHFEQRNYSPQRQKHTLYWRSYVEYNGNREKRYELFPNQLYQVLIKKDPNSKEFDTLKKKQN